MSLRLLRAAVFLTIASTLFLLFYPTPVLAIERILSMDSNVTVHENGSMTVLETITVRAEGTQIKRGIYREFPTRYKDPYGNTYRTTFTVLQVQKDGKTEDYHTKTAQNGVRLYIGSKDRFLSTGVYTYTITYRTDRQLGFFKDHDELYWNATGNGWGFFIEKGSATVKLPSSVPPETLKLFAYTGPQGSKAQNYTAEIDGDGRAVFRTTSPLRPYEGLTLVVGWPKGYIREPSRLDRTGYLFSDNLDLLVGLIGLLIVIGYYYITWKKVGKDPEKGTIIPHYGPPDNLSPAASRYILKMGFDHRSFTAAIIDMGVKGYLSITNEGKDYTLKRNPDADMSRLSRGETRVANKLFGSRKRTTLKLKNKHHTKISGSIKALKKQLAGDHHKVLFNSNKKHLVPGILVSIVVLLAAGIVGAKVKSAFLFMTFWLSIWTVAVVGLWLARNYLIAVIFTFFEIMGLVMLTQAASLSVTALVVLLILINVVFFNIIKAPTLLGRSIMDKLEGFKMYLEAAEKDRLQFMNPPERTPELFEKFLPYAFALDVDQEWSEQFSQVLSQAGEDGEPYSPGWYHGSHWNRMNLSGFTSGLGSSLNSAISSSSTAPGSSSGGGGGGSSGGGGGGGGGGGW
ncbi:MAG: DUF2207 domain-containing protein [bacterium]